MRVLITGDRGFIGKHVTAYFESLGDEVIGWDIKEFKDILSLGEKDFPADLVVHCAASCRIRKCIKDPRHTHDQNAIGGFEVIDYARRQKCPIIYFSSSRTLSKHDNIYTATKKYGEELCKAYSECYGIKYKIIRPSTVYGPGDTFDRIIPKFICNALKGKDITIFGDEHKTLDIMYIDDFISAFDLIMKKGEWNTSYDIGNNEAVKVKNIAEFIINTIGKKVHLYYAGPEKAQPQKVRIDNNKILELGYLGHDWRDGIKKTISWIRKVKHEEENPNN